ncbi:MAG: matrixin family metalloprotease, partial [Candidatus Heimdallarchaeota archaeon]|nr:matrixin family metalloprotease [Candidatus Heimdallarchaeota archaeon]
KFQKWAGLKVDGIAGPITARHLMAQRICGTPDAMSGRICKWPMKGVTWAIADSLPGVSDAAYKAAAAWATRQWNQSCGIALKYTVKNRTANLLMRVANLGGPGDSLADSQLPCGANSSSQILQRYDASEPWYAGAGQPPNGKISLRAVCVHELGHAIGIGHLQPGGPRAIMQPYYRPDLLKLLEPSIALGFYHLFFVFSMNDPHHLAKLIYHS